MLADEFDPDAWAAGPQPDPADAAAVWAIGPGQRPRLRRRYIALVLFLVVPMTLTASLGTISFSGPDGTAIASFWPAAAFQIVFSIWFGVYGAVAGIVGPMLGNHLVGASAVQFVPGNAIQSCLPGLWFRYRRLDPRLRSRRDWTELILVGVVLANALGAMAGAAESGLRDRASTAKVGGQAEFAVLFLRWFMANTIPCLILAPAMLKAASAVIVQGPFFCQSFWGAVGREAWPRPRLLFRDLPMVAKLLLLTLVAGILPLCLVAAWSVWDTLVTAEHLAAAGNRQAVQDIRDEVERHALLLRMWAAELARPGLTEPQRAALLDKWRALPETFETLTVTDQDMVRARMPVWTLEEFSRDPVVFYQAARPPAGRQGPQGSRDLWGAARLEQPPGKALTGRVAWRADVPLTGQGKAVEAVLVLDRQGHTLHWDGPTEMADWRPEGGAGPLATYTVRHAGRAWHVAEARLEPEGWRFVALTGARKGATIVLANVPNYLAALINFAIFGCFIGGSALARRISQRVLTIAEHVRQTGAEPGKLRIPMAGHDELGYLAQALNRMSRNLAENVRRLQETTAEKERLEAELDLAREVQRQILPARPPEVSGYEFAAASHPAREVGGDFYDFFVDARGRVVMLIGDAVGKGLKAAMFITEVHGLAHSAARERPTPESVLSAVNFALTGREEEASDFVTMLCAVLDPTTHELLYANAGHSAPILLRDGRTESLELGSLPLAVSPEADYQLQRLVLAPGDAILMYTDGVTEAFDTLENVFEIERLEEVLRKNAGRSAGDLLQAILHAVWRFSQGARQVDDVTLLVFRRCPREL